MEPYYYKDQESSNKYLIIAHLNRIQRLNITQNMKIGEIGEIAKIDFYGFSHSRNR